MTTYPLRLEGIVLAYTDGGTPVYRTFKSMEVLEHFVGRFFLNNHRSDSHWVDAIVENGMTVIDDSVRIEHDDEDANFSAEPKNNDEHLTTPEENKELQGSGEVADGNPGTGEFLRCT